MKAEAGEEQPPPEIAVKYRELDIREQDNQMRHEREGVKTEQARELGFSQLAAQRIQQVVHAAPPRARPAPHRVAARAHERPPDSG